MSAYHHDIPSPRRGQPGEAIAPRPPSPDPRAVAFGRLLLAVDNLDRKGSRDASRELRALGFSVCLIKPAAGNRGRS